MDKRQLFEAERRARSGAGSAITIYQHDIELLDDDHMAAIVLDQLIFYERNATLRNGGWFDKTYEAWYRETRLSKSKVARAAEKLTGMGIIETKVMKNRFGNHQNALHYRINWDTLASLTEALHIKKEALKNDEKGHQSQETSLSLFTESSSKSSTEKELKTPQSAGRPEPAAAPDSFVEKTPAKKAPTTPPARIPGKVGVRGTNYKGDDDVQYTGDTYGDEAASRAVNSFAHDFLLGIYNFGKLSVGAARQKNFNKTIQTRLTHSMLIGMVPRKSPDYYLTNFEECREYVREELQKTLVKPIQGGYIEKVNYFIDNAYKFIAAWVSAEEARRLAVKEGNEIRIAFTSPDGYPRVAIWREGNTWIETEPGLESPQAPKSKDEFIALYQNELGGKIVKNTEEVEL